MANRFILLLMLFIPPALMAQEKFLKIKVSLECEPCSAEMALERIGNAANVQFAYDASLFSTSYQVRIRVKNVEIATILKEILGKDIRPREVGNHIILVRNRKKATEKKEFSELRVSGLVLDSYSGRPVAEATIYEVENRYSAISGNDGKYKIRIPTGREIRSLTFCKSGYADTVIFIRQIEDQRRDIALRPLIRELGKMQQIPALLTDDYPDTLKPVNWMVPKEVEVNARNLRVGSPVPIQVSLIPYIGTNWKVSGSATNRFSLNILAGYSGGLDGVEIGGLLNMTRNVASGVQIGGLVNYVEGNSDGVQVGGLVNFVKGNIDGVQIGGLVNYSREATEAVQVAGLVNYGKGRFAGVRIAGLVNISNDSAHGVQIAGLFNLSNRHTGGFQMAGLVNYARVLSGVQLGFINVASTVERGTPIGFFSYVSDGYHLFELSANEIFYANLSFKSGTKAFYNIFQIGIGDNLKFHGAYGIGTAISLSKKMAINFESTAGFVLHPTDTVYHGLQLKVIPTVEYRFAKRFALFAGPSWNFFLWSKGEPSATARGLSSYDFYFKSTENASIQMWIGGVAGIRL